MPGSASGAGALGLLVLLLASPAVGESVLCFDEAHDNVHTAGGKYAPLSGLARDQDLTVLPLTVRWSADSLPPCDLLVSAAPRGAPKEATLEEKSAPAFLPSEVTAVAAWLAAGHGLLLVTDHPPIAGATAPLADGLGIGMSDAFTEDPLHTDPTHGHLVYSRESGLLAAHPITDGRSADERVETVGVFVGQSLVGPPGAVSLLTLASTARDRVRTFEGRLWHEPAPTDPTRPAGGRSQAIAFELGAGRVVALGEAAMLTSLGPSSGFEVPGLDNARFAGNILRWLAAARPRAEGPTDPR